MLEETGDEDETEFGVIESPVDGVGGGLGVEHSVSTLLGRGPLCFGCIPNEVAARRLQNTGRFPGGWYIIRRML